MTLVSNLNRKRYGCIDVLRRLLLINQGLISIEAPIVKDLLGASVGDYAFFNDKEYELISIK